MRPKHEKDPRPRRVSPFARVLLWVLNVFVWLILSLVVSIIVEWVGIFTWWEDQGFQHSVEMFNDELQYANETVTTSLIASDPQGMLSTAFTFLDDIGVFLVEGIRSSTFFLSNALDIAPSNSTSIAEQLTVSSIFITKTFILRLHLLLFAIPLIVLLFWHALIDGLVERDLRKAGGARESNVIFDFSSTWTLWIVALSGFIYLASPISLHPLIVLLPSGALFFIFARTMFASYKKHI